MRIQFGNWIFNVKDVNDDRTLYSRLTGETIHSFEVELAIDNEKVEAFDTIFEEYRTGDVLVSSENLKIENGKFDATIKSTSTSNLVDYKTYVIGLKECCSKNITGVEFKGIRIQPYSITQELSNNAIIINLKTSITQEQLKKINELQVEREKYFEVKRLGIDDSPLLMRFGRNLWSKKDDELKMALVLVEKEYDKEQENFHGLAEPQLSIAIKQIEQLKAVNMRLLSLLLDKQVISTDEKFSIEEELTLDERKQQSYLYDQVNDIDDWR